jgi:hypothetical protein
VTWLAVPPAESECEAVLALQPEAGERLRTPLALSWRIADPALLQECRVRMASVLGCGSLTAGGDASDHPALAYAEQFALDQKGLTEQVKTALAGELSERELVNLVQALNVHDGWLRILTLLDVAPPDAVGGPTGEPALEQAEPDDLPGGGGARWATLTEPTFMEARMAFGAATALLDGVDDFTTECCRLLNASYQACAY